MKRLILLFLFFNIFINLSFSNGLIPSIKFKDTDIKIVLQSIAQKATKDDKKVNVVISPKVTGQVTVDLENVDWFTALKGILEAYGYSYKWIEDNIILVGTIEEIKEKEEQERSRQTAEIPKIKIFKLKYIDANDAKKTIQPLLSPQGRANVLEATGQAGWEFGQDITKRKRVAEGRVSRTKILVVSDISKNLEEIEKVLKDIDVMPKQILIKARIMEVRRDFLKEIGFDWGTGITGAPSVMPHRQKVNVYYWTVDDKGYPIKATYEDIFTASPQNLNSKGTKTFSTQFLPHLEQGLEFLFQKLTGTQFEVLLRALEEDKKTNVLSAPSILTLNNQEASILVGTKFPLVSYSISSETGQIVGGSLDRYQDIGIQLNVVPQICGENEDFINLIIHPAVTSFEETTQIISQAGIVLAEYPIILSRETETQILLKDGETVVIGGLLRDVKSKSLRGIPFLSRIPILGWLFKKETNDTEKIDLLIFITSHIVKSNENIPKEVIDKEKFISQFEKN